MMNAGAKTPTPPKKPYSHPALTTYGSLKDIVQGSHGKKSDGSPGNTKGCWIAEAVYGETHPKTMLLRSWMTRIHETRGRGWIWVELYRRFGRTAAAGVRMSKTIQRLARPMFDRLVERALAEIPALAKGKPERIASTES